MRAFRSGLETGAKKKEKRNSGSMQNLIDLIDVTSRIRADKSAQLARPVTRSAPIKVFFSLSSREARYSPGEAASLLLRAAGTERIGQQPTCIPATGSQE